MYSMHDDPQTPKPNPSDGNIYSAQFLIPPIYYHISKTEQDKPLVLTTSLLADQLAF